MIDVSASICRQVNGVIVEIIYVFPCKRMMEGQETLTLPVSGCCLCGPTCFSYVLFKVPFKVKQDNPQVTRQRRLCCGGFISQNVLFDGRQP